MTKQDFLKRFEDILELDAGSLKGDEPLMSLDGWDSLAVVTFIAMVDENFETALSPAKIAKSQTVADLISLLGDKITA
jgi:acyl carrier protein